MGENTLGGDQSLGEDVEVITQVEGAREHGLRVGRPVVHARHLLAAQFIDDRVVSEAGLHETYMVLPVIQRSSCLDCA